MAEKEEIKGLKN